MKENNVYDNTKIILVSDHGPSWWHYKGEVEANIPWVKCKKTPISLTQFLRLNPLLMVKDFNAKGKMNEDWRLMSNKDSYAIAFNKNDPTKIDFNSRTVSAFYTVWDINFERKLYVNKFAYEVSDNVYDLNNWKKLNLTQ